MISVSPSTRCRPRRTDQAGSIILRNARAIVDLPLPDSPTTEPFSLRQGERLGLVGESGSGKSTIALALLRMIKPPGRIVSGSIVLDGDTEITTVPESDMPEFVSAVSP